MAASQVISRRPTPFPGRSGIAERRVAKFGMGEAWDGNAPAGVFALSGAMAGAKHRLDLFGVLVLSYAAGNAGGITRDLLIGAVPPAAISDWRYRRFRYWPGSSPSGFQIQSSYCARDR
jgi:hypothetical protein